MGTYGSQWEAHGYSGAGQLSDLVDSVKGRPAVVCGNADGVFSELLQVQSHFQPQDLVIFAANDVGMYLPKLDHWCTLHSDNLAAWKQVRWLNSHVKEDTRYHAIDERAYIDYVWNSVRPLFALSGYFAMQIAYIMGCDPIILCGCPGTQTRRFFEGQARSDFGYGMGVGGTDDGVRQQVEHEMKRLPEFKSKVKSMSGWTADFFGRFGGM